MYRFKRTFYGLLERWDREEFPEIKQPSNRAKLKRLEAEAREDYSHAKGLYDAWCKTQEGSNVPDIFTWIEDPESLRINEWTGVNEANVIFGCLMDHHTPPEDFYFPKPVFVCEAASKDASEWLRNPDTVDELFTMGLGVIDHYRPGRYGYGARPYEYCIFHPDIKVNAALADYLTGKDFLSARQVFGMTRDVIIGINCRFDDILKKRYRTEY